MIAGPVVCHYRQGLGATTGPERGEEPGMPTYSYRCEACHKSFALQMNMADHDKARVKCPKCGSRRARQQFGAFSVKTSKKS